MTLPVPLDFLTYLLWNCTKACYKSSLTTTEKPLWGSSRRQNTFTHYGCWLQQSLSAAYPTAIPAKDCDTDHYGAARRHGLSAASTQSLWPVTTRRTTSVPSASPPALCPVGTSIRPPLAPALTVSYILSRAAKPPLSGPNGLAVMPPTVATSVKLPSDPIRQPVIVPSAALRAYK